MRPEHMAKVQVICTRKHLRRVIKELHAMKVLHIIEHKKGEIDIGRPLEESASISEILVKVRGIINFLKIDTERSPDETEFKRFVNKRGLADLQSVGKTSSQIYDEIAGLLAEQKEIESQIVVVERALEDSDILKALHIDMSYFRESRAIAGFLGTLNDPKSFLSELHKRTKDWEVSIASREKTYIALFVRKSKKAEVQQLLSNYNFVEYRPSSDSQMGHDEAKDKSAKLLARQGKIQLRIEKLREEWSNFFIINEKRLAMQVEQENAPLRFGETKSAALITGWMPESDVSKVGKRLNEITKGSIVYEKVGAEHEEDMPIKLNHIQPVKSFEWFMDLYSLPHYHEIDPTLMMFFTFPLFFGFMLGDVGYGLVTLMLFLILRRLMPDGRFLLNAMILCSISSIIFGLVFGEFFGFEELGGYKIPHLISRAHEVTTMLIIGVAIGFVHVNIGFITGFINELHHGLWRAICEKASWIIIEIGIGMLILSLMGFIIFHWAVGATIAAIGVILLAIGEGAKGVIELPTLFSHSLSYARLMAVGLASVVLAVVVNNNSMEFIKQGGVMAAVGIFIMVVGHSVNIALGIIGPFLHSLRLHYVEFFTKFYRGGGKKYTPFGEEG